MCRIYANHVKAVLYGHTSYHVLLYTTANFTAVLPEICQERQKCLYHPEKYINLSHILDISLYNRDISCAAG